MELLVGAIVVRYFIQIGATGGTITALQQMPGYQREQGKNRIKQGQGLCGARRAPVVQS